jgi:hypothetical protein
MSASALQAMAPETFQSYARAIVLDKGESPELQATSLSALAQFGKAEELLNDEPLRKRVDELNAASGHDSVKQSAQQFVTRYKR